MCKIKGLSEVKVEKIKEAAGKLMVRIMIYYSRNRCSVLTQIALWIHSSNDPSRDKRQNISPK